MTMQAMASFVEKAQQDPALAEELVTIIDQNDTDAIYSKVVTLANDNGFSVTVDDVKETRQQFEKMSDAGYEGDMSDDELDNVSGGIVVSSAVAAAIITGGLGVAAAGVGAAGAVGAAGVGAGGVIAAAVIKRGINNTVNDIGNFFKKW